MPLETQGSTRLSSSVVESGVFQLCYACSTQYLELIHVPKSNYSEASTTLLYDATSSASSTSESLSESGSDEDCASINTSVESGEDHDKLKHCDVPDTTTEEDRAELKGRHDFLIPERGKTNFTILFRESIIQSSP
ncbi:hypothetical protein FRC12_023750 [Ceratobasidium sp. 428]|nr:hypothetical protein FRC12_023750 [Ceratobasidium sp. 428]